MMTFYEEFGVPNDASVEEIRQAYKTLARVLHPDGQTDEKLRAAAVRQMKRLHEILGILKDPRKRRAYDESLAVVVYSNPVYPWASPPAETIVPAGDKFQLPRSALRHWFWALIVCAILGCGFWYIATRTPAQPESALAQPPAAAQPDGTGSPRQPAERSDGLRTGTGEATLPEEVQDAAPSSPPGSRHASGAPASLFAGDWGYTSPYPMSGRRRSPVLIEFRLAEKDGILDGDYRARYEPSQPLASQGVLFQVRGKSPVGDVATLAWTSADGASGEMDLFLQPPNSLQVTWWTIRSGRHSGLSADAATLRRQ